MYPKNYRRSAHPVGIVADMGGFPTQVSRKRFFASGVGVDKSINND
jgi:hypothetical protein